ncbi:MULTISPECIES: TlpA family protein disulfide reductase [unclassified Myroides]|uniref:TlpA family protein disulfide reductase n=1 Tax=unclassified Myroides TaxID=2642485 RepID=UPI003D2F9067
MSKNLVAVLLFVLTVSCKNGESQTEPFALEGVVEDYHVLLEAVNQEDDKVYVVNFWATWCVPCVKELPDFVRVYEEYKERPDFEMVLVSLDRSAVYETKVKPFIEEHQLTPPVVLLADVKRMNEWIPAIDKSWSGAIPATAIYKNGKQIYFHEGVLSYAELKQIIQ